MLHDITDRGHRQDGGGVIQGSTYCSWPKSLGKGEVKQHYVDQSFKSMTQLARVAEDNNVILNMEILNRFEQFIFNTVAEALPFVRQSTAQTLVCSWIRFT